MLPGCIFYFSLYLLLKFWHCLYCSCLIFCSCPNPVHFALLCSVVVSFKISSAFRHRATMGRGWWSQCGVLQWHWGEMMIPLGCVLVSLLLYRDSFLNGCSVFSCCSLSPYLPISIACCHSGSFPSLSSLVVTWRVRTSRIMCAWGSEGHRSLQKLPEEREVGY